MVSYRIPGPLEGLITEDIDEGAMCRTASPRPGPLGESIDYIDKNTISQSSSFRSETLGSTLDDSYKPAIANRVPNVSETISTSDMKAVNELSLSNRGLTLLKDIEQLRLQPYDDQTGKEITAWTVGATIGYGHLIKRTEWDTYKDGITVSAASILFEQDLSPFVNAVRSNIKVKLKPQQFDALVMLAFNIGAGASGFSGSSVVKLVNDPEVETNYKNLEAAWKAWSKSQGKVMKGLENRRACEWNVYSQGIYKKW